MQDFLTLSHRLYGVLLSLYPEAFRAAYGQQMRLTFQDASREAHMRGGVSGLLAMGLPTLFDLFKSALEERARHGVIIMSRDRLISLSAPLTIIIGLLWILASIGELVLLVGLGSLDSFWDAFWTLPVFVSFILLIPATIGARLRYKETGGEIGRLGLILSVAGCAGMLVFVLVSVVLGSFGIEQETWPNYVIFACMASLMSGYVLFGIDAVRNKPLPHWNVTPLLVGLPTVLLALPSLIIEGAKQRDFHLILVTTFLRFALTGIGWVLFGLAMSGERQEQETRAAGRANPAHGGFRPPHP